MADLEFRTRILKDALLCTKAEGEQTTIAQHSAEEAGQEPQSLGAALKADERKKGGRPKKDKPVQENVEQT